MRRASSSQHCRWNHRRGHASGPSTIQPLTTGSPPPTPIFKAPEASAEHWHQRLRRDSNPLISGSDEPEAPNPSAAKADGMMMRGRRKTSNVLTLNIIISYVLVDSNHAVTIPPEGRAAMSSPGETKDMPPDVPESHPAGMNRSPIAGGTSGYCGRADWILPPAPRISEPVEAPSGRAARSVANHPAGPCASYRLASNAIVRSLP